MVGGKVWWLNFNLIDMNCLVRFSAISVGWMQKFINILTFTTFCLQNVLSWIILPRKYNFLMPKIHQILSNNTFEPPQQDLKVSDFFSQSLHMMGSLGLWLLPALFLLALSSPQVVH